MKSLVFSLIALLLLGSQARAASKEDLYDTMRLIDSELSYYNQSPEALAFAQSRLSEALSALRGGPALDPQACLDFAFNEYRLDGYSNSVSLERGKAFCDQLAGQGSGLRLAEYLYKIVRQDGYSRVVSLQISLELSAKTKESKLSCIDSAFSRYRSDGLSRRRALEKAVELCGS